MNRTRILFFVAATVMMLASAPNLYAYSLASITADAVGNGSINHPGEAGPTSSDFINDVYAFDLGITTNSFWVGLSFDHAGNVTTTPFDFTVTGASYSGTSVKIIDTTLDSDDWAMLWRFDNNVWANSITINLVSNMVLTSSLGGPANGTGVEIDGVAVPEPSTLLMLGSGIAGLGFIRRKFRA